MHISETIRSFPFEPGQVVVCDLSRPSVNSRPIPLTRAIVLRTSGETSRQAGSTLWKYTNEFVTVQFLAGGKPKRMKAHSFVHAGWCAACELPAHQGDEGLICPRCEGPANEPPPDLWIRRTWNKWETSGPLQLAQALRTPELTRYEIWYMLNQAEKARRAAMYERFGVRRSQFSERANYALSDMADVEDAEGFARELQSITGAYENLRWFIGLVREAIADDAPEFAAPVALAPLPAEQVTPDGEDDISRWLRTQAERHERRKAA